VNKHSLSGGLNVYYFIDHLNAIGCKNVLPYAHELITILEPTQQTMTQEPTTQRPNMETIFYVLFRSTRGMHDFMTQFNGQKTFNDYMEWQLENKKEIESNFGGVVVENFDIKYRKITN